MWMECFPSFDISSLSRKLMSGERAKTVRRRMGAPPLPIVPTDRRQKIDFVGCGDRSESIVSLFPGE